MQRGSCCFKDAAYAWLRRICAVGVGCDCPLSDHVFFVERSEFASDVQLLIVRDEKLGVVGIVKHTRGDVSPVGISSFYYHGEAAHVCYVLLPSA